MAGPHHFGGGAADDQVADARMAIGAHDQKVDVIGFDPVLDHVFGFACGKLGVDAIACGAQDFCGLIEFFLQAVG
tara:strand:+ start:425 stop:649 length:225 start_codon:yes stop_codon:yes gene_type:complete